MSTFTAEYTRRLLAIEARSKAVRSNMTQVCKNTGVARPTFERCVKRAPQSITKVDVLEQEVERLEREHAERLAAAPVVPEAAAAADAPTTEAVAPAAEPQAPGAAEAE